MRCAFAAWQLPYFFLCISCILSCIFSCFWSIPICVWIFCAAINTVNLAVVFSSCMGLNCFQRKAQMICCKVSDNLLFVFCYMTPCWHISWLYISTMMQLHMGLYLCCSSDNAISLFCPVYFLFGQIVCPPWGNWMFTLSKLSVHPGQIVFPPILSTRCFDKWEWMNCLSTWLVDKVFGQTSVGELFVHPFCLRSVSNECGWTVCPPFLSTKCFKWVWLNCLSRQISCFVTKGTCGQTVCPLIWLGGHVVKWTNCCNGQDEYWK